LDEEKFKNFSVSHFDHLFQLHSSEDTAKTARASKQSKIKCEV